MGQQEPVIRIGRLQECTFEQTAVLRHRGFEGYNAAMKEFYPHFPQVAPDRPKMPPAGYIDQLLNGFGTSGIRPEHSVVAFVDEQPVGFVFLAVKTVNGKKIVWNGGTGVFPEYRGYKLARLMMEEAGRVIDQLQADDAVLEVVAKNIAAVKSYERGGFSIADKVIGMTQEQPLPAPFWSGELPDGLRLEQGKPEDVSGLSFYREKAAWGSMWHNLQGKDALLVYNADNEVIGYALYASARGEDGTWKSVTLRQCEVHPDAANREQLFRVMLDKLYGPSELAFARKVADMSMAHEDLIRLLEEAGFITNYEQYVMWIERQRETSV